MAAETASIDDGFGFMSFVNSHLIKRSLLLPLYAHVENNIFALLVVNMAQRQVSNLVRLDIGLLVLVVSVIY